MLRIQADFSSSLRFEGFPNLKSCHTLVMLCEEFTGYYLDSGLSKSASNDERAQIYIK
jgi:hypothetical protein